MYIMFFLNPDVSMMCIHLDRFRYIDMQIFANRYTSTYIYINLDIHTIHLCTSKYICIHI